MALLEKTLFVKKSTLPAAGKGLFTKKFIEKGSLIAEYKGRITTWKDVESEETKGENKYIYYVKRNHVIDARPYQKALAKYANDARGLERIKGISNNAEYVEKGLKVFIKAIKDIPAGSEILVAYGKEYWDAVKHNIKMDKKRKNFESGNVH